MQDKMKMLFVIYATAIEPEVSALIEEMEIDGYTRWEKVQGMGGGEKRYGSRTWPGTNTMRLMVDEEEKISPFIDKLKELRDSFARPPALKIFKLPVEKCEL